MCLGKMKICFKLKQKIVLRERIWRRRKVVEMGGQILESENEKLNDSFKEREIEK